jgi:hypothetical protein
MVSSACNCNLYASNAKLADTYVLAGANLDTLILHTMPSTAAACDRLPPPPATGRLRRSMHQSDSSATREMSIQSSHGGRDASWH